jgi:thiamine biosynthesis lipoprotein
MLKRMSHPSGDDTCSSCVVAGDFIFLAHHAGGFDRKDITHQMRAAFESMRHTLASVGATLNDMVQINLYLLNLSDFDKAREISALTGGAYDITCAPLISLWGFGPDDLGEPTPHVIDSIREFVGYRKAWLDGRRVVKADPRVQLNASSLAKGYAVDLVAELLENQGIVDYMVEIGGEIRAHGVNPKGGNWRVEISKPIDDLTGTTRERMQVVSLHNMSIATSGNYRNYYIRDGKKVAHTINPLTGYPAETDLLSISILYADCLTADAVATACMVIGADSAQVLVSRFQGMTNSVFL